MVVIYCYLQKNYDEVLKFHLLSVKCLPLLSATLQKVLVTMVMLVLLIFL